MADNSKPNVGRMRNEMMQVIRENNTRAFVRRQLQKGPGQMDPPALDFETPRSQGSPESIPMYADGGEVDDSSTTQRPLGFMDAMKMTWPYKAATDFANYVKAPGDALAGKFTRKPSTPGQWSDEDEAMQQIMDSQMMHRAIGATGQGPAATMFARAAGPAMGATAPVFVGPFGAFMLRQADRNLSKPHPVYGQSAENNASRLRPEFQDIYKGWQTDIRDAYGRQALETRAKVGKFDDSDVWKKTGWSFDAAGNPVKEVPDIGAKLSRFGPNEHGVEIVGSLRLDHPAGDLHKIYDIPPITRDPRIPKGDAATEFFADHTIPPQIFLSPKTGKDTSNALHEVQHIIQAKEGLPGGANPMNAPAKNELFGRQDKPSWQMKLGEEQGYTPEELKRADPWRLGQFSTYHHNAGEVQSRNVQDRRAKSYRYGVHPQHTESVARGVQIIGEPSPFDPPKFERASGGKVDWTKTPEHHQPFRSGMLNSSVPGRTDKLPLKVPSGSYVLPADIPSALGQGNTMAGADILGKMFNRGPFGMNISKRKAGTSTQATRKSRLNKQMADGGEAEDTDIIAAGGEYLIPPEVVMGLGGGDMTRGHDVLDRFVKDVRNNHIKTLKKLPPPAKD